MSTILPSRTRGDIYAGGVCLPNRAIVASSKKDNPEQVCRSVSEQVRILRVKYGEVVAQQILHERLKTSKCLWPIRTGRWKSYVCVCVCVSDMEGESMRCNREDPEGTLWGRTTRGNYSSSPPHTVDRPDTESDRTGEPAAKTTNAASAAQQAGMEQLELGCLPLSSKSTGQILRKLTNWEVQ